MEVRHIEVKQYFMFLIINRGKSMHMTHENSHFILA